MASARWRAIRVIQGRPRLFSAFVIALLISLILPHDWRPITRLLIAWNVGTWLYFVLTAFLIANGNDRTIRRAAKITDEGKFAILVLTIIAAAASIGAIGAHLASVKDLVGLNKGLHIGLAAATIVSAWFFIHLTFGLHYAHEYFDEVAAEDGKAMRERGGLLFPKTDDPDYYDFLYFSFVIGVASQTADVAISSKAMRRTALVHCVLAFFFNSAVLALTINIAAGLI